MCFVWIQGEPNGNTATDLSCLVFSLTDPSVLRGALSGHTDSVWGLVYSSAHQRLLSCSADGTVRLWDANTTSPALAVFNENKSTDSIHVSRFFIYSLSPYIYICPFCSLHQNLEFLPLLTWCAVNQLTWSHPSQTDRSASSTWRPANWSSVWSPM